MANLHIKTGGAASSPFATWANAATTLGGVVTPMVAGDTIFASNGSTMTSAGMTVTVPGTTASPSRIISGTEDTTSGITAVAAGAVIGSTNATFSLTGNFFADAITWRQDTASTAIMIIGNGSGNVQWHRDCRFEILNSTTTAAVQLGTATGSVSSLITLERPVFKFSATGQRLNVNYNVRIIGGSIDATGTAPTGLVSISSGTRGAKLIWDDLDATNMAAAGNLITAVGSGAVFARFCRAEMPASWTGAPVASGQLKQGDRVELIDAHSGSTLYRLWVMDHAGSVRDESTVKVTAQTRSFKFVSSADCSIIQPLYGPEYTIDLSGSAQTVSLDICTDNVTLTDGEAWLEVDYLATSGELLGTIATDRVATSIASTANQTTSSTTWTTTGLSTPVRQTLSVSVTAGAASRAIVRMALAKPSTTAYSADTLTIA